MTGRAAGWTRRGTLAGAAAMMAVGRGRADPGLPRLAALDWGWAASALTMGFAPVGISEKRSYTAWVGEPAIPSGTAELGLRTSPSLETLLALRPDLILTNSLDAPIVAQLERLAPTLEAAIFTTARQPLAAARAAVGSLATRVGRPEVGAAWLATSDRRFAAARSRLAPSAGRPVLPLQISGEHQLTYYGQGSLFADVLAAVGLRCALEAPTSLWGHYSADIASLAVMPAGDLLVVAPVPPAAAALLDGPSLFTSLAVATHRQVYRLPPVWTFGELSSATRFAEVVADALTVPPAINDRGQGGPA